MTGISVFKVRYVTRGKCKKRDGHGKWLERHSDGGRHVNYTYFKARISIDGEQVFLGNFPTAEEAAEAIRKAKAKHGV